MKKLFTVFLTALFILCSATVSFAKEKVILDTDMVDLFDDGVAMMLLAKSPKIDLLGVTIVIGNTWAETGTASAIRQLEGLGRNDIPVMVGINTLTRPDRIQMIAAEQQFFGRGGDPHRGAGGYPQPESWQAAYRANYGAEPIYKPADEHAVDFIIRQVKANPHEVTLVSIGTCANIAAALRRAPEIAPLTKRIVYMGGSFGYRGNVSPFAEFNFWFDPEAARTTVRAPFPEQIIVPLNACEKFRFDLSYFKLSDFHINNPWFQTLLENHWTAGSFRENPEYATYIWDVLTAALIIDPSVIMEEKTLPVDINVDFGPGYGQSLCFLGPAPAGARNMRIVYTVNEEKVWKMVFDLFDSL